MEARRGQMEVRSQGERKRGRADERSQSMGRGWLGALCNERHVS